MRHRDAPATASAASTGRPFRIVGESIPRGEALSMELPVARLPTGTWASMPLRVIHGLRPGPTLWLSAAIHGDELNGVMIVRGLMDRLKPSELIGTVLAVPIVNIFGVTIGSRYMPDRRDLNRSFPGSSKGSLAARLANLFFTAIASRCDLGLDFHTASNGRSNLPQIRCDLDNPTNKQYAEAFAPPVVIHAAIRDGSLRAAARKKGIGVLIYEAGEADRLDPAAIEVGISGSLRVLHTLGMLDRVTTRPPSDPPLFSRKTSWVRAPRSGFCVMKVAPGQFVKQGDHVASVDDGVTQRGSRVTARMDGVVIGVLRTAIVHRGDALLHVAEIVP